MFATTCPLPHPIPPTSRECIDEFAMDRVPLRVAIAAYSPEAVRQLAIMIADCGAQIVYYSAEATDFRAAVVRSIPDIVFICVNTSCREEIEAAEALVAEDGFLIALVARDDRYALRALEMGAIGYLLLPCDPLKLEQILSKTRRCLPFCRNRTIVHPANDFLRPTQTFSGAPACGYETALWVRERGRDHIRLPTDAIQSIVAQDDYACMRAFGREHLLRSSLDRLMKKLNPSIFIRVHRSAIVNIECIAKIAHAGAGGRAVILKDGSQLPLGRVYGQALRLRLIRSTR